MPNVEQKLLNKDFLFYVLRVFYLKLANNWAFITHTVDLDFSFLFFFKALLVSCCQPQTLFSFRKLNRVDGFSLLSMNSNALQLVKWAWSSPHQLTDLTVPSRAHDPRHEIPFLLTNAPCPSLCPGSSLTALTSVGLLPTMSTSLKGWQPIP